MNFDFKNINVLLIGDFMIDQYVLCDSTRISPEANVPVLTPKEVYSTPGGAGNVAKNLSELGANVTCVGSIGLDEHGLELKNLLQQKNINTKNLYETNFPTTLKKRYYLKGKQVLRVDIEEVDNNWIPPKIDLFYDKYDLIIISDYNKGVLNNPWFTKIEAKNIFVDPKKKDFSFYSNATIITPNLNELQRASKKEINSNEDLVKVCQNLITNSNLEYILAKKGDKGMTIVGKDGFLEHIDAKKVDNPDVTGAGDTVISAFSLSYFITNDIRKSARIANAAAALVVGRKGTSFITIDELNSLENF